MGSLKPLLKDALPAHQLREIPLAKDS